MLQHVACPVNTWFAICGRWEFRNELLGLTGRHMGELNILTAPCFKTQNYFLTKKIEKKKKIRFHREIEGKGEKNHLLLKNGHQRPIIFCFEFSQPWSTVSVEKIYFAQLGRKAPLGTCVQQLLLEHSHSCTQHRCWIWLQRDTEPHSLLAVSNRQFEDSNSEYDFEMHSSDLWARFPLRGLGVELLTTGGQPQQSGCLRCKWDAGT